MDESDARLCEIQFRLEKLERENRRMKTTGSLAVMIAASLFLMGQAKSDRTIEAQKFVLKDASGKVGAELAMDRFGARLNLHDANGRPVVTLVGSDAPSLGLMRGEESISLFIGANHQYGLALYGKKDTGRYGGIRAGLAIMNDIPALSLYDKNQRERITLEAKESAPSVILRDAKENENLRLGYDPLSSEPTLSLMDVGEKMVGAASLSLAKDGPNLELWDRAGYSAILGNAGLVTPRTGEAHQTSAASLVLFDKEKNVIWKAP
jgi:hypothetical protein